MPAAPARWRASRLSPFRVVEQSADRADELARATEVRNGWFAGLRGNAANGEVAPKAAIGQNSVERVTRPKTAIPA
jgi:hypothetical protein